MLVQFGRLEFTSECFRVTIGKTCTLPSHCNSVTTHHLSVDGKIILICIGYLGDPVTLRTVRFYELATLANVVPEDLLYVVVERLGGGFDHAFLLPRALLDAFAPHPILSHDFYIDKDFRVCKRGDSISALLPFTKRKLTLGKGLIHEFVLDRNHVPFVCVTDRDYTCADVHLYLDDNFKKSMCRSLIVVNTTHALCSHAWVQFPDKLCPMDYRYRTGLYRYPELCTPISESDESKIKTEGNWLTTAIVAAVDWLFKAAEKVIDFLESCVVIVFGRLWVLIYHQLESFEVLFNVWDEQYLLFELLLLNFVVVYRSNLPAAALFTVIFGILFGYNRNSLINFRILTIFSD